jgi:hypothetical protein
MALYLYRSGTPVFYVDQGTVYALDGTPQGHISGLAVYDRAGAAIYRIADVYFHEVPESETPLYFDPSEIEADQITAHGADATWANHLRRLKGKARTGAGAACKAKTQIDRGQTLAKPGRRCAGNNGGH